MPRDRGFGLRKPARGAAPTGEGSPAGGLDHRARLTGMVDPRRRLTVIEGGAAERERTERLLRATPWVFSNEDFDRLCGEFGLSPSEAFDLAIERIRHKAKTSYEASAVLAIFEGGNPSEILARGRRADLRLETCERPAPPQQASPGDEARS